MMNVCKLVPKNSVLFGKIEAATGHFALQHSPIFVERSHDFLLSKRCLSSAVKDVALTFVTLETFNLRVVLFG